MYLFIYLDLQFMNPKCFCVMEQLFSSTMGHGHYPKPVVLMGYYCDVLSLVN